MAISFPPSPQADGTTYSYNGVTYVYALASDQWIVQGTGSSELYVLKTGDTMTGKLTGTTADFSGKVDIGGGDIELSADGSAEFAGDITAGEDPTGGAGVGASIASNGYYQACRATGLIFRGYTEGNTTATSQINADGSATFGKISIGDPTSTVRAINLRGTATAQIGLQDDASTNFRHDIGSWATGSGNFVIQHSTSGIGVQLTGSGATSWSSFSDLRLKDVTGGFVEALDDVKQLEPIRFTWKSDDSKAPHVGLSAQSVQSVLPEAVDESPLFADASKAEADREVYLSVRYTEVIPLLVAALQESTTRIEALEAKVQQLEGGTN